MNTSPDDEFFTPVNESGLALSHTVHFAPHIVNFPPYTLLATSPFSSHTLSHTSPSHTFPNIFITCYSLSASPPRTRFRIILVLIFVLLSTALVSPPPSILSISGLVVPPSVVLTLPCRISRGGQVSPYSHYYYFSSLSVLDSCLVN